jgi:hypothetical protein
MLTHGKTTLLLLPRDVDLVLQLFHLRCVGQQQLLPLLLARAEDERQP